MNAVRRTGFSVAGICCLAVTAATVSATAAAQQLERSGSLAQTPSPVDFSFYAQLASDYVYRGISYGGESLSPSIAISANHRSGLYATFWAGRDDIAGVLGNPQRRDIETEYTVGYQRVFNRSWSAAVRHSWHEYLRRHQPRNHDYQETQLHIHYRDYLGASIGFAENIWTSGRDALHVSASYRHGASMPYINSVLLEHEVGVTRFGGSDGRNDSVNLHYFKSGVIKNLGEHWSLQFDYHFSDASRNNSFNPDRIGSRTVVTVGFVF